MVLAPLLIQLALPFRLLVALPLAALLTVIFMLLKVTLTFGSVTLLPFHFNDACLQGLVLLLKLLKCEEVKLTWFCLML